MGHHIHHLSQAGILSDFHLQVMCILSQPLWARVWNCLVVSRNPHLLIFIYHLWILKIFTPNFLQWLLILGSKGYYIGAYIIGLSSWWPLILITLTYVNHHLLQKETSTMMMERCINYGYNKSLGVSLTRCPFTGAVAYSPKWSLTCRSRKYHQLWISSCGLRLRSNQKVFGFYHNVCFTTVPVGMSCWVSC